MLLICTAVSHWTLCCLTSPSALNLVFQRSRNLLKSPSTHLCSANFSLWWFQWLPLDQWFPLLAPAPLEPCSTHTHTFQEVTTGPELSRQTAVKDDVHHWTRKCLELLPRTIIQVIQPFGSLKFFLVNLLLCSFGPAGSLTHRIPTTALPWTVWMVCQRMIPSGRTGSCWWGLKAVKLWDPTLVCSLRPSLILRCPAVRL